MLTDEQFDDRLRSRLASEVAHVHADPDLLGALNRRYARRVAFTRAAFAVPVAVAVVATGAVVVAGVGGQRAPAAGASVAASSQAQLRDVAYVTAHIETALASQYVMRSRMVTSDGYVTAESIDTKTQKNRTDWTGPDGPQLSTAVDGPYSSSTTTVEVDYRTRQYWILHNPPLWAQPMDWQMVPAQRPEEIRAAVGDGTLEILGRQRLDGRDTLHLRLTSPRESTHFLLWIWGALDLWVDASTYLPYRLTGTMPGNRHATVTYEWLPRTAANLATLDLAVPAGFKRMNPK